MKLNNLKVEVESNITSYIPFHIHNKYIGTCFNNGNITNFNLSGKMDYFTPNSFYSFISIIDNNIHKIGLDTKIKVVQDSKFLNTSYNIDSYFVNILSFIGTDSKSVIYKIEIEGLNEFKVNYCFGANLKIDYNPFKSDSLIKVLSKDLNTISLMIEKDSINNKVSFILAIDVDDYNLDIVSLYNKVYKEALDYKTELDNISNGNNIKKWALNQSISLYKTIDSFKCVFAGIDYSVPFRTYYRDSYYTCLSFIKYKSEYVKDEIVTLAYGIDDFGHAPSAITEGYKGWWDNHLDSPLFFILLLNSYINETKDIGILNIFINNKTIKDIISLILDNEEVDETGLIIKKEYDRLDWCDNVYRTGYVTYIECLYYGSLIAASKYVDKKYEAIALKVKKSINDILWNEKTNALYNFKSDLYLEDNISLDTIFAIIFGVLDNDRSIKMLKTFESNLETINNNKIKEDYGVMCVYPNYKYPNLLTEKSSYPYRYHNGANWPYLTNLYALSKKIYKMDYSYPINSFIDISLKNNYTSLFEYYSPYYNVGSLLQGWSSDITLVYDLDNFDLFR